MVHECSCHVAWDEQLWGAWAHAQVADLEEERRKLRMEMKFRAKYHGQHALEMGLSPNQLLQVRCEYCAVCAVRCAVCAVCASGWWGQHH